MMVTKKQKEDWKKFIIMWKGFKPPVVPSKAEIDIYRGFLKGHKGKKALVFGATPELRDLLYELGYNVTLIDFNEQNIYVMTKLMKHKPKDETVIVENWLKLDRLKLPKFDVIVGDHFLNNLPFSKYGAVLRIIKRLLAKDGLFITNIMVSYDEDDKVKNKKITDIKGRFEQFYRVCTNTSIFNKKKQEFNFASYDKKIADLVKTKKLSKQVGDSIMVKMFTSDFIMSMPRIDNMKKLLEKHFSIIDIKYNTKHPVFKYYQIYKLK